MRLQCACSARAVRVHVRVQCACTCSARAVSAHAESVLQLLTLTNSLTILPPQVMETRLHKDQLAEI